MLVPGAMLVQRNAGQAFCHLIGFEKTLAKWVTMGAYALRRRAVQKSNHRHRRLLRARRERPRGCRAAKCGQQFPPSDGDCHAPLPCEGA
jgi:hypothetical protein